MVVCIFLAEVSVYPYKQKECCSLFKVQGKAGGRRRLRLYQRWNLFATDTNLALQSF